MSIVVNLLYLYKVFYNEGMSENSELLFSIIIPVYNSAKTLERVLASVVAQTVSNWECIAVDDGSSDNSREVLHGFIATLEADLQNRFHSCSLETNQGPGYARGYGARHANGDYFLFCDGDDMLDSQLVSRLTQVIIGGPREGFSLVRYGTKKEYSSVASDRWNQNEVYSFTKSLYDDSSEFLEEILDIVKLQDKRGPFSTCQYAFNAELYRQVFYQPKMLFEDVASIPALIMYAKSIRVLNGYDGYSYCYTPGSIANNSSPDWVERADKNKIEACKYGIEQIKKLDMNSRVREKILAFYEGRIREIVHKNDKAI